MSMKSSYFSRSQKLTYAIDAVKNAMVTMIQIRSCMSDSLVEFFFTPRNNQIASRSLVRVGNLTFICSAFIPTLTPAHLVGHQRKFRAQSVRMGSRVHK